MRALKLTSKDADTSSKVGEHEIDVSRCQPVVPGWH